MSNNYFAHLKGTIYSFLPNPTARKERYNTPMSAPILATKLYIPTPRTKVVIRPRLIKHLNEGLDRKLTLISASAGFGKTTLVSTWVADCKHPVAWLSLDDGDNNLTRFLMHLVAALQKAVKKRFTDTDMGREAQGMFQAYQSLPTESFLTALLNDISAIQDRLILVLDDYHEIDSKPVEEVIFFLLEHLPPQMHIVIATRIDPALPLAKLRARNQLMELRAADLRFTIDEASEFLKQTMGLNLSKEDITNLETRTEGWIAGLQLAALSMQGQSDPASFVHSFAGNNRFVLDYLIEEVLERQPVTVSKFLLETSILDKLSGSLCDAVTGRETSKSMLDNLDRRNLFITPLDYRREWYRYHHLFADMLQTRIMEEHPEQLPDLHHRASLWYENHNMLPDAIRHALSAKSFVRAADLIEQVWAEMDINLESSTWFGWAKTLPDELIQTRPVISVGYAWALLEMGEADASENYLKHAEQWLVTAEDAPSEQDFPISKMVVVDKAQFRSLRATIATARAYRALAIGDLTNAVQYAQQAFGLTPEEDYVRHTQATTLLGLALYARGDLEAAKQILSNFQANMGKSSNILTSIGISLILAEIREVQGQLRRAIHTYQQALQLIARQDVPIAAGEADLYRGISELLCEQNDLEAAAQAVLKSKKLSKQAVLIGGQHRLCIAEARLMEAQGDLDHALVLLNDAEEFYIPGALPDPRSISALRAKIWVAQGKLTEALMWADEKGLSSDDSFSFTNEFEYITLVRILIARYRNDQIDEVIHDAIGLLDQLLNFANEGGRIGRVIEILILQAMAHEAGGNISLALKSLQHALTLAEPEGYIRIFVNEGRPMEALLREAERRNMSLDYIRRLLKAFRQFQGPVLGNQSLNESLSERELEVLALLQTDLSGPEIAEKLMIALSTMRTHTQNIYRKLGVNNRRAVIRRAEELDLL